MFGIFRLHGNEHWVKKKERKEKRRPERLE